MNRYFYSVRFSGAMSSVLNYVDWSHWCSAIRGACREGDLEEVFHEKTWMGSFLTHTDCPGPFSWKQPNCLQEVGMYAIDSSGLLCNLMLP